MPVAKSQVLIASIIGKLFAKYTHSIHCRAIQEYLFPIVPPILSINIPDNINLPGFMTNNPDSFPFIDKRAF